MALITAAQVVSECGFDNLTDTAKFSTWIPTAEMTHIKNFLGATFYATLETQVAGDSLSTPNQNLWDTWLKKACAFAVAYEAIPHIAVDVGNQGVQILNAGDFSANASVKSISLLQESYLSKLGIMIDLMDDYMRDSDNSDDYTDYNDHRATREVIPGSAYFGFIKPKPRSIQ